MTAAARRVAKGLLAQGLLRTGCWELARRRWARRGATVVLTYHRVLPKLDATLDYSQPGMVVSAATFERQLDFVERHFDVVGLDALVEDARGRAGRPRCAITFDDGWRDNHDVALPILRRRGLPATIFLTTDYVGTDAVFWHTELIYLLLQGDLARLVQQPHALRGCPPAVRECLRRCVGSPVERAIEEADRAVEAFKTGYDETTIARFIGALGAAVGVHRPFFPGRRFFLDWDQVRDMASHGFEIGSHGCTHRIMTRLSFEEAAVELHRSRAEIERQVGRPARHFAFPNESATSALTELAARAGYRTACGGVPGRGQDASPIVLLRRAGMHEGMSAHGGDHDDAVLALGLMRSARSAPA